MTGLALEVDGWPPEPCDTATPVPPTRAGHGSPYGNVPDGEPRAYRRTVTVGSIDNYQPQGDPT
ncbi:hypothetical protein [Streptomyces sp. NBC_01264]|uniref:hypothetical protein n=1 Tax=Streptomyces sp. NBC_01264 TaxID=2903804 RepID=UPI002258A65D|nr:hypothetical protein [Streptomyces sp. NBC_01264]MCX4778137.1 hypothetical protein [Streptomyces sp. NBC_01264]